MNTGKQPRILVVAEFPPGAPGGDWVNIKKYFRGLDWNQVYWWSLGSGGTDVRNFGGRHSSFNAPARLSPNRRLRGVKGFLYENFVVPRASSHLLSFIREVKPDLIFVMARGWIIPIAHAVMPQVKAHWHTAIYDMPDAEGIAQAFGQARVERQFRMADDLYKNASSRSVISPAMVEEMQRRTGAECKNLFRCAVEPEAMELLREPAPKPPEDVIKINYAGTIIVEETFKVLVSALRKIRGQLPKPVEIHLYGSQKYGNREWFDPTLIIENGFLSEAELNRRYKSGTWGLAIMGIEDVDPQYNHYSFPCKFSMSLACGLPLIIFGNRNTPLIELARRYNVGIVITDEDVDKMSEILLRQLGDFSHFDEYRSEILRCAETEFNAEANRRQLHEYLASAKYIP